MLTKRELQLYRDDYQNTLSRESFDKIIQHATETYKLKTDLNYINKILSVFNFQFLHAEDFGWGSSSLFKLEVHKTDKDDGLRIINICGDSFLECIDNYAAYCKKLELSENEKAVNKAIEKIE